MCAVRITYDIEKVKGSKKAKDMDGHTVTMCTRYTTHAIGMVSSNCTADAGCRRSLSGGAM